MFLLARGITLGRLRLSGILKGDGLPLSCWAAILLVIIMPSFFSSSPSLLLIISTPSNLSFSYQILFSKNKNLSTSELFHLFIMEIYGNWLKNVSDEILNFNCAHMSKTSVYTSFFLYKKTLYVGKNLNICTFHVKLISTPNTAYNVGHTIFSTLFSVGKLDE